MRRLVHRLANLIFSKYSLRLDQLNYNAALNEWLTSNDMPVFPDREALHRHVNDLAPGAPVDYLEFGVFQGDSIRLWSQMNTNPESRFIGFDSFEGLPVAWGNSMKAGSFSTSGVVPEIADPRVSFQRGWFNDTLPQFLATFCPRAADHPQ